MWPGTWKPGESSLPQDAASQGLYHCNRKQTRMKSSVGAVLYSVATQREGTGHRSQPSLSFSQS